MIAPPQKVSSSGGTDYAKDISTSETEARPAPGFTL
jgi:hypothetical protein